MQHDLTVLGLEISVNDRSWGLIMEVVHTYSSVIKRGVTGYKKCTCYGDLVVNDN